MESSLVTCTNCGWVHFAVTRKYAEDEVRKFNIYFDSLPTSEQDSYYGGKKSSVERYEGCMRCQSNSFRETRTGDCPNGCTVNPVIVED